MSRSSITIEPLVSVIIPAYNAARYIGHTLRSLVTQTYTNLEIIVVDDGSRDATVQMVQKMIRSYPQISIIQQTNAGVAAARNAAVRLAKGEFIAPVDADDIWFPEAAQRLVARLQQSEPNVGLVYTWSVTIDEGGLADGGFCCSPLQGDVLCTLLCHNFIGNASSTLIRRSTFERVGGYDCQFHDHGAQGCEDWDLYLRIAEQWRFCVVPEFLVGYRKSRDSMTSNPASMANSHRHLMHKMNQRHPSIPNFLYRLSTSSFYFYLASECHRQDLPRDSYRWLYQSIASGTLFTLMRPGFYGLVAKNGLAMLTKSLPDRAPDLPVATQLPVAAGRIPEGVAPSALPSRLAGRARRRLAIQAKLLFQVILHRVISRLPKS